MIGLGRMGSNMVRRLMKAGHDCVVFDVSPEAIRGMEKEGATGSDSLRDFVQKLAPPRAVWMMVPAAIVDKEIDQIAPLLQAEDILIDGGNSYYIDDIRRARDLKKSGIHYVDVGTSGGVFGLERGYCLMIGGEDDVVRHLDPIFAPPTGQKDAGPPSRDISTAGPTAPATSSRWSTTALSTASWPHMPRA
jgi:6-phosphogluconate dehydrogenase